MTFDLKKFITELHTQFGDTLHLSEVEELLDLREAYNKDTPLSTGKKLLINQITFYGKKITEQEQDYSGRIINYQQEIANGVNIWIADNFKGKSSILKIIKYALTGSNSIKQNIKKWLTHIILNFSISDKEFTIYLNTERRTLVGSLFNGRMNNVDAINQIENEPIFEASGESEYQNLIEEFFFKQFSYYSLRWTQKHPRKNSNELLEVGASWSTYFKSILLESKDSNEMYGSQGKKVFQMLLGLELTYPINQLSVKRDMLNDEKAKQNSAIFRQAKKQLQDKAALDARLLEINNELNQNKQESKEKININSLYQEYNLLIEEIKSENEKSIQLENQIRSSKDKLRLVDQQLSTNQRAKSLLQKELEKNRKRVLDLEEYLEIGRFFSNLDIKHCPSCNHSVPDDKKRLEIEERRCSLCTELIDDEENQLDNEVFDEKINNLKKANTEIIKDIRMLDEVMAKQLDQINAITSQIATADNQKINIKDTVGLNIRLKEVENVINSEREKVKPIDYEREQLIGEKAIIEFKIKELENTTASSEVNYDLKIELLTTAITKLNNTRFQLAEKVLKRLSELMLVEIHEFGLNSITEINISDNFDIQYKQDGDFILFDNIAEGEQLRVKIAFYLSLIQLDIEYNFGRHPRLLIIDSPGKEEGDANYLEGLSQVLKSINERFGSHLQILIGTAERRLSNVAVNQFITPENSYVF